MNDSMTPKSSPPCPVEWCEPGEHRWVEAPDQPRRRVREHWRSLLRLDHVDLSVLAEEFEDGTVGPTRVLLLPGPDFVGNLTANEAEMLAARLLLGVELARSTSAGPIPGGVTGIEVGDVLIHEGRGGPRHEGALARRRPRPWPPSFSWRSRGAGRRPGSSKR